MPEVSNISSILNKDAQNYAQSVGLIGWINHLRSNTIDDQWYIWRYIVSLRYSEHYKNRNGIFNYFFRLYFYYLMRKYGRKTGFQIPPGTVGSGLTIWHWGPIIINPAARIGENCTLYPGVLIGHKGEGQPAPKIGNNVFIGSGAKIIGGITIGNNVTIGPNTVIVKDVPDNATIVGAPARIIKIGNNKVNITL